MPVHYGDRDLNCVTISSTLATQKPKSAGTAYALKRSGKNACAVCYFGDGAASEGDAHAAFNISATTEAPIIWMCRNNGYAISTPTKDQYRGDGIAARAYGYGMYAHRFDGNDIFASYIASKKAREICIEEQRPIMMEGMTYRGAHHSTSDDSKTYREHDEEHQWRNEYNPLRRLRVFMERELLWNEKLETEMRLDAQNQVDEAARIAQHRLKPHWKDVAKDMYDVMPKRLSKQMEEMEEHLKVYGQHEFYKMHEYEKAE